MFKKGDIVIIDKEQHAILAGAAHFHEHIPAEVVYAHPENHWTTVRIVSTGTVYCVWNTAIVGERTS